MRAFLIALASLFLLPAPARAQELPYPNQALLMLRSLAYDRNLKTRSGEEAFVAVIYDASDKTSQAAQKEMAAAIAKAATGLTVGGLPVRVDSFTVEKLANTSNRFAAFYICPGARESLEPITKLARAKQILTFSGSEANAEDGVSVALIVRKGRPGITINLNASRAEGADLHSDFLRVARVIR